MAKLDRNYYQCLPSTGKSFLAKAQPSKYIDTDVTLEELFGDHSKTEVDMIYEDPAGEKAQLFVSTLLNHVDEGKILLTNCNLEQLDDRFKPIAIVGYTGDNYLQHIRVAQRLDLLENFDEDTLLEWADSYTNAEGDDLTKIDLNPMQYLSHVLN